MAADLKTATSAIPGSQIGVTQLTTSEAALYTCASGAAFLGELSVTNVGVADATALVSLVKSGGTGGVGNRIIARTLVPGETAVLKVQMNEGDFLSGKSDTSTAISVILDGTVFSNSTGAALSGIQDDAMGTTAHTSGTGAAVSTCSVGSNSNRRLYGGLIVRSGATFAASSSYTTLTMTANGGAAMTKKVSADFGPGGGVTGSVHLFELANPTSSSTQTLTASVIKAGVSFDIEIFSLSLSGINSSSVTASSNPTTSSTLNVSISSAAGHKVLYVCGFDSTPQELLAGGTNCVRALNGAPSGFTAPHVGVMMLALGAATTAATTSNTVWNCGVGLDLVPA